MIGIGSSRNTDSLRAGQECGRLAVAALARGEQPGWALAFCGGGQDPDAVLKGLQGELGTRVPVLGGSTLGTLTNEALGCTGCECAAAVFPASLGEPRLVVTDGLDKSEEAAGARIGNQVAETGNDGDVVLLFYDSVRSVTPFRLHVGSRLVEGFYEGLGHRSVHLVGAGTVADKQITRSFIYDGERMKTHSAAAAILPRSLAAHTVIMHGCEPVSDPLEITRIEGPVVYELNKRPAMDVIRQTITDVEIGNRPALTVTLGEKHGHPEDPYDESRYINRLILGSNPVDGSVTLFEADFKKGTKVQIMQRSNRRMIESVRRRTRELLDSLEGQTLLGALYIDCGGRAGFFCQSEIEEGDVLREALGGRVPLLGFYSGVEIAPLLGRSRPLDWTGVLTIFADTRR